MAFWGQTLDNTSSDPKRKFRFKVSLGGLGDGVIWYAKTTSKPEMTISNDTTHKFLGHTFKFPGSVTWNDIEMTLVDPVSEDAATKLLELVEKAGYVYPKPSYKDDNGTRAFETISKGKSKAALEEVTIEQIDADGETIEMWTLHNAFINKVGFGDLSYEDDGLSEISLGITYDWATFGSDDIFDRELPQ